jgi:hypothetical protein
VQYKYYLSAKVLDDLMNLKTKPGLDPLFTVKADILLTKYERKLLSYDAVYSCIYLPTGVETYGRLVFIDDGKICLAHNFLIGIRELVFEFGHPDSITCG